MNNTERAIPFYFQIQVYADFNRKYPGKLMIMFLEQMFGINLLSRQYFDLL
jgi:hypothetical protein